MESIDEESSDLSPIELLPTEILEKIIGYLPVHERIRVERVCKKWQDACTGAVWKDAQVLIIAQKPFIDLGADEESDSEGITDPEYFEYISKTVTIDDNTLHIDVGDFSIIESIIFRVGKYVREFLFNPQDCKHEVTVEAVLNIVAIHCHNIEKIQLYSIDDAHIKTLSRLLKINKKLHSIACIEAINIIEMLPLKNWKSLHFRDTNNSPQMSNIQKEQYTKKMATLIEHSPSLEKLCVWRWGPEMIRAILKCGQLKDMLLLIEDEIVRNNLMTEVSLLNRLTRLKVRNREVTDDLIINLLQRCMNLESLSLHYDKEIPSRVLEAVLALPKLESLELDGEFTPEILSRFVKFKHLKLSKVWKWPSSKDTIIDMIMKSECLEKLDVTLTEETMKNLILMTKTRTKILKLKVSSLSYRDKLKICEGSKIQVYTKLNDYANCVENCGFLINTLIY